MQGKRILESLQSVPRPQDYPTADYIIIKETTRIRLNEDGRISTYSYQFRRITKDFGRDRQSDISVLFNEKKQKINILSVQALMLDGTIVPTPEYGINQITPHALEKAPHFSDFQHKIISLVGLETGGYAEFEYEIEDLTPWQPSLYGAIPIRTVAPALDREIVFETPVTKNVIFQMQGQETEKSVEEQTVGGIKRTIFRFYNQDLWDKEDDHALAMTDCPKLVYAEETSWDGLAAALGRSLNPLLAADDQIEKRVTEITKDLECPLLRSYALHKHVLESVNTINFDPQRYHYQARSAIEILKSGYGTAFEKAVLLCAMLSQAGYQAEIGLACPSVALPQRALHLALFDTAWVMVKAFNLFLRPDKQLQEARREHLEGNVMMVAATSGESKLVFTDAGLPPGNRVHAKVTMTLKDDASAQGSVQATLTGIYNPYFGLLNSEVEQVTDWVKGFVGKLSGGAELDKHNFKTFSAGNTALSAACNIKKLQEDPEHRILFEMPAALSGIGNFSMPSEVLKRASIFSLPGTLRQEFTFDLTLPKDWTVAYKPTDFVVANDVISFEQKIEMTNESGKPIKLVFKQCLLFKEKYLKPELYADLHSIIVENARPNRRLLAIVKKSEP